MAERRELSYEVDMFGQRHAREVELELRLVALTVAGTVEHRVDVGEDVLRAESRVQVAAAIADEAQPDSSSDLVDET